MFNWLHNIMSRDLAIDLADPIKTVGDFEVPVKLHREVVGKAKVKVEAEA